MKILRIAFDNINIFSKGFSVDFTASDRVIDDSQVYAVSKSIYTQKVMGFVGINASGKTTALKLIIMAMEIVAKNRCLSDTVMSCRIMKDNTIMTVDFVINDMIYRLESVIGISDPEMNDKNRNASCYFREEKIYSKTCSSVKNKKQIFEFDNKAALIRSEIDNEIKKYLDEKQSIVKPIVENDNTTIYDSVFRTNFNVLTLNKNNDISYVNLFDNNIDKLQNTEKGFYLKFKNDDHSYNIDQPLEVTDILSSGTIKGTHLMSLASYILKNGGYLIVDEMENHMNKRLVQMFIRLFTDNDINKKGACLIFTTHYMEIVDTIERKDNIYVLRRNADMVAEVSRYSDHVKRNDVKKSDILLSNYIEGTAPSYDDIQKVREALCKQTD